MGRAKDIHVAPISSADARRIIKRLHYSGKVANNSQLHFGIFLGDKCQGAMQFGPSMDKRRMRGLVRGTGINEFLELNRMALGPELPRNSESRVLGVALRMIRREYPQIKWVVSFADATMCGDGAIYRAAGFLLVGVKKNRTMLTDGVRVVADKTFNNRLGPDGKRGATWARANGWTPIPGYQLRYIYFLDPSARERLTVPEIPFSEIDRLGAGMYLGKPRAASIDSDAPGDQSGEGGVIPTAALQGALNG